MSALIGAAVVRDGAIYVDEFYHARMTRHAKQWANGTALRIRIEPEEEAYTYADIKHYWGHVIDPFCETTGYHKHEAHAMLKVECMPEGKTSITELNRKAFRAYSEAAEQKAREWCPDAFLLYDERHA